MQADRALFWYAKAKVRQLYHVKLRNIRLIAHLIRAACVLHNISLEDDFNVAEEIVANLEALVPAENEENKDHEVENVNANIVRDQIANSLQI
ncbi:hypothetical protein NQ314_019804 [Rhamnusium bicolor]|uniref:DDE Tnp4 domain-containing protein n=1 Tax=Rhamnusium bicolor TaxID=1586634 RepID=A0AAV8WM86_9CUCU|nr:hypothetical protein NQ314_019804 [Rhamnusium bicolor]